jgi:hypothetical protein
LVIKMSVEVANIRASSKGWVVRHMAAIIGLCEAAKIRSGTPSPV